MNRSISQSCHISQWNMNNNDIIDEVRYQILQDKRATQMKALKCKPLVQYASVVNICTVALQYW